MRSLEEQVIQISLRGPLSSGLTKETPSSTDAVVAVYLIIGDSFINPVAAT